MMFKVKFDDYVMIENKLYKPFTEVKITQEQKARLEKLEINIVSVEPIKQTKKKKSRQDEE